MGGSSQVTPQNVPLFVSFQGITSKFSYIKALRTFLCSAIFRGSYATTPIGIRGGVGILSVILQSPIDVQTVEFYMSILCSSDDTIYAGRIKLQTWVSKLFNGCGNKTMTKN